MKIRLSQVFLAASIMSVLVALLWLMYPEQNRGYHLILTGMTRGRIYPFKAKFKPYQGKKMGGAAGTATVVKETIASFSGAPFNVLSLGSVISGTGDAYLTRGEAIVDTMNSIGVEAMLPGNLEFSYGQQRLLELSQKASFSFVSSNVEDRDTGRAPAYFVPEVLLNPGGGMKVGVLGITPPETPNLTAKSNVEGLIFSNTDKFLRSRVEALRKSGADLVILLTMFSRDRITLEEWRSIASASPDVCVMLDYEIDAPPAIKKDGVIIKTLSGYNQSKEIDVLNLEIDYSTGRVVKFSGRRIAVNHAEIAPDPDVARLVDSIGRQTRAIKDTHVGTFAADYQRNYAFECAIGNLIGDAMIAETGCELALHNSGGIQGNIQAGDMTLGELFSILPFDNHMVKMSLKGSEIKKLLQLSASLQRGLLQISGGSYSFSYRSDNDFELGEVTVGSEPLDDEKFYSVCTNSFLADGGDNFTMFSSGTELEYGRQQRDVVADYIKAKSEGAPIELKVEGRIARE